MNILRNTCEYKPPVQHRYAAFIILLLLGGTASATTSLIDFDDLIQAPCDDGCEPTWVNNQYASLGVTFIGAGLYNYSEASQIVSQPNAISDFYGPGMSINFTGNLPTTVQLYVSSFSGYSVAVLTYGADGKPMGGIDTDGWRGIEENSTPYRDQQLVAFSGAPISKIEILDFSGRRSAAVIDNLQFGNGASVPLPASLGLFASALSGLWLRRHARGI